MWQCVIKYFSRETLNSIIHKHGLIPLIFPPWLRHWLGLESCSTKMLTISALICNLKHQHNWWKLETKEKKTKSFFWRDFFYYFFWLVLNVLNVLLEYEYMCTIWRFYKIIRTWINWENIIDIRSETIR